MYMSVEKCKYLTSMKKRGKMDVELLKAKLQATDLTRQV